MTDERVTATVGAHEKDIICLLQATFKHIGENKLDNRLKILSLRAASYDKVLRSSCCQTVQLLKS